MRKVTAMVLAAVLTVLGSVAVAQETSTTVQSSSALPFMVDIEKTPGWMVYLEGGYQWNFFRGAGLEIRDPNRVRKQDHYSKRNHTEGGAAGAIALGYNFCPKFPLTVGMKIGAGPSNKLQNNVFGADGSQTYYWERVGLYTLDFALDYDFKNKSRVTPFVGVNFGAALISQKARAWHSVAGNIDTDANTYFGKYDTKRRVNLMGGVRTGVKYDVNPRVALTFFGQYSYLGSIKGKGFEMANSAGDKLAANTTKMKAHMLEAKLGIRIAF